MKKQLVSILAFSLALPILVSCGGESSSSSGPISSSLNTTSSSSTSSSSEPVIQAYDFSTLENGTFIRKYNSRLGQINILKDSVILNETTYKPVYKSGEDFSTVISLYLDNVEEYTLSFETFDNENWPEAETVQTKITDLEGNETLIFPSLQEVQGSYDAYNFNDDYKYTAGTMFFNFQDEFNSSVQGYYMGYGSSYFQTYNTYYSKTYLMRYNDEYVLSIDMLDYEDDYLYDTYIVRKDSYDNLIYLVDPYESNFYASMQFLTYSLFDGTNSVSFTATKDSITIGESAPQSYSFIFDEDGQKIQLADKSILQGTAFGLTYETTDGLIKEYVYDTSESIFEGKYSGENITYNLESNFDSDTYEFTYELKINGTTTTYTFEIKDHRKSISSTLNNNKYFFVPDRSERTLKAYENNEITYLINNDYYDSTFLNSFINHVNGVEKEITFGLDNNVTYGGTSSGKFNYVYDPLKENPYITFTLNDTVYTFEILDTNTKAFTLKSGSETLYFFNKETITALYNDYTEKVSKSLSLSKDAINFNSSDNTYTIKPRYVKSNFAYTIGIYFSNENKDYILVPSSQTLYLYQTVNEQEHFINSYITTEDASNFVGKYNFQGTYGVESMELKSDGSFYADTADKSGKLTPVEYSYSWSKQNDSLSLTFNASATSAVPVTYHGTYVSVFTNKYIKDYIYNYQGVYANDDHIIYLNDGSIYVDGTEQNITSSEKNENNETIINYGSYQATFSSVNSTKQVVISDGTTSYTANEQNIDLASFVGEYTYTLSSTDYTANFKLNTDPISGHKKYVLDIDGINYDYVYVLRNGYLTMKFSLIGTYIYLYNNGTSNIIEAESSIPLPPAPPAI